MKETDRDRDRERNRERNRDRQTEKSRKKQKRERKRGIVCVFGSVGVYTCISRISIYMQSIFRAARFNIKE